MRLVYFAWVREKVGTEQEDLAPPETVNNIASLIHWLKSRDERYMAAFQDPAKLRFAINQDYADMESPIGPEDEVAIFPPVTGG